ncbi:unnamed protein product [Coffea canephora]|uniref:Uncharacterized protein n=1 Tax=Coffea canephora TaxID=49390 RepID=A0A068TR51_COFCA|nr:unnamed protein product [Coffea canephora]
METEMGRHGDIKLMMITNARSNHVFCPCPCCGGKTSFDRLGTWEILPTDLLYNAHEYCPNPKPWISI